MSKIPTCSGIYQIINLITGDMYIGSAVNLYQRWANHKKGLKQNKHHSIILQRAYNKYGFNKFKFNILLYCDKVNLLCFEQKFLDAYTPKYNICKIAGSSLGTKRTAKQNLKSSLAHKKLTAEQEREIINLVNEGILSRPTIAKKYNIGVITLYRYLKPHGLANRKGYKIAKEAKDNFGKARIGIKRGPMSEDQKQKLSLAKKGCLGPNKGKSKLTLEEKQMLLDDIKSNLYNKNDLVLKYKISKMTIHRIIQRFK